MLDHINTWEQASFAANMALMKKIWKASPGAKEFACPDPEGLMTERDVKAPPKPPQGTDSDPLEVLGF